MTKLSLILPALGIVFLASCSTTPKGEGPTVQGRREFELMKYRDPATGSIPENIRERELVFAKTLQPSKSALGVAEDVQDNGEWFHRGPWNIGGRTRTLAIDAKDNNTLLAGAVSGGLWKSTDGGATWSLRTRADQLHTVMSIAQDAADETGRTWYYTTGEIWGNSAQISGNGVWKSTNGGDSWEIAPSTSSSVVPASGPFAYTWRIQSRRANNSSELYVATSRAGVYRSQDGSNTWQPVLSSNGLFTDVVVTPSGTLYAAISAFTGSTGSISNRWGVFRSVDGTTWQNVTPPDMTNQTRRIVLCTVPQHPEQIWAVAETPGTGAQGSTTYRGELRYEWHSLWKYTRVGADTGEWLNLSANIPLRDESRGDFYSQGGYDLLVRVSPHDSNVVFLGGTNLYRSTNGFRTPEHTWVGGYWKDTPLWDRYSSYTDHHPDQHDVVFHPTNTNVLYSVNDGGIQKTTNLVADSIEWIDLNRGYLTTQFYTVDLENKVGSARLMGGMQDNATWATDSVAPTTFWRRLGGGDGAYCYYADSGRTEFYSSQQGRMFRIRRDADGNEIDRTRIDPGGNDYIFINPYVLHPKDEHVVYLAAGPVMMRNSDVRAITPGVNDSTKVNWDTLRAAYHPGDAITAVCAFSAEGTTEHTVVYGTSVGKIYVMENSSTGQPTTREITQGTMPRGAYVNSITVNPTNNHHMVVCFSNYGVVSIWETFNAGESWTPIAGNLEENSNGSGSGPAVNWVGIMPDRGRPYLLVAATSTGVYFTPETFGMSTVWTPTATELVGNVPCDMVVARPSDGTFAVATHGRGVISGSIVRLPPPPVAPELQSPPHQARGIYPDTVLVWKPVENAGAYRVRVWNEARPDSVMQYSVNAPTTSVRVVDLEQGPVQYRWQVEAISGGGLGESSPEWTFTTAIQPPQLLSPAAGATNITVPELVWRSVAAARTYGIEVGTNAAFNPVISKVDGHADTSILVRGLENGRRYFWRVRSADADTAGLFSARQSFVAGILTSVDVSNRSEQPFSVDPNPASDVLTVCTNTPDVPATIVLSDVEGRTIVQRPFSTCIPLDVRTFANGTYVVTVTINGVAHTASVVVQR